MHSGVILDAANRHHRLEQEGIIVLQHGGNAPSRAAALLCLAGNQGLAMCKGFHG
jgi:hypothetical protein